MEPKREAVKEDVPKPAQKTMGREDFTRGQAIGHGSYGTVFKVEFHNRKIESRINKAVSADSTKPVFYALKEMMIQMPQFQKQVWCKSVLRQVLCLK